MIRKLRRQFNRITILMLVLVLLIPLIGVNLLTRFVSYQQTDTLLQQIAESSSYGLPETKPPFEQAQKNPQEPADPPAPPNDDKKEEPAPSSATDDKFFERDHKRPIDVLNDFTIYLNADGTFLSVSDSEQCSETEAQVLLEAVQKKSILPQSPHQRHADCLFRSYLRFTAFNQTAVVQHWHWFVHGCVNHLPNQPTFQTCRASH